MAEPDFDQVQSGASKVYPMQASAIKKGGYVVIKNRPCKVVETSTSKTGKHGHAKVHMIAIDIFTQKKLEEICPSTHNMSVPEVTRADFQLLNVSDDGFVSLLTGSGDTKDDLKLPAEDDSARDGGLRQQIIDDFNDGKDLLVTVLSAMDQEQIIAVKVNTTA